MIIAQLSNNVNPDEVYGVFKILSKLGFRLIIDIISMFMLVRFVYYSKYKHKDLFFTFFIFNIIIFFISFLLNKVDLSMGAAFGLFAVFSMLRYRTEDISIKDMTYLFLAIAIGLICAVTKIKDTDDIYEYVFLVVINATILIIAFLLESNLLLKMESSKIVVYEKIELIHAQKSEELIKDLCDRTGLQVNRYTIQNINFLRDSAIIKIYYQS